MSGRGRGRGKKEVTIPKPLAKTTGRGKKETVPKPFNQPENHSIIQENNSTFINTPINIITSSQKAPEKSRGKDIESPDPKKNKQQVVSTGYFNQKNYSVDSDDSDGKRKSLKVNYGKRKIEELDLIDDYADYDESERYNDFRNKSKYDARYTHYEDDYRSDLRRTHYEIDATRKSQDDGARRSRNYEIDARRNQNYEDNYRSNSRRTHYEVDESRKRTHYEIDVRRESQDDDARRNYYDDSDNDEESDNEDINDNKRDKNAFFKKMSIKKLIALDKVVIPLLPDDESNEDATVTHYLNKLAANIKKLNVKVSKEDRSHIMGMVVAKYPRFLRKFWGDNDEYEDPSGIEVYKEKLRNLLRNPTNEERKQKAIGYRLTSSRMIGQK